jgi:light-independent protochlorophyllide reductase subunit B
MFREDFEFHDAAGPSHHGGTAPKRGRSARARSGAEVAPEAEFRPDRPPRRKPGRRPVWLPDAERELKKIPFFVRGKAKRNTEKFAAERGCAEISVDTLYEAKAHYAR